jgi:hypothetical protein
VRRPAKASAAVARFADGYRERHGLGPQVEFFIGFWRRLPDAIDVRAFESRGGEIAGWIFTADDRMEPVSR